MIRDATEADALALCEIYNHYIAHSLATFETEPLAVSEMARRIAATTADFPWLLGESNESIAGYAYATRWKPRQAYRHTVESTVYLSPEAAGQGMGTRLMCALLQRLEGQGVHAVLAGIALPNDPSVALHEKLGFTKVAHFRQTGRKFDQWVDVGYWEKTMSEAPDAATSSDALSTKAVT
ncbi:MAG: arsinothricin resistance N-acetyltransferase ArsN1 family B [Pseudomonadota bacterium]